MSKVTQLSLAHPGLKSKPLLFQENCFLLLPIGFCEPKSTVRFSVLKDLLETQYLLNTNISGATVTCQVSY